MDFDRTSQMHAEHLTVVQLEETYD